MKNSAKHRSNMEEDMKKGLGLVVIGLFLLIISGARFAAGAAEQMYLTDTVKVMMRSGPGIDYKITAMLTVGQPVEIMETSEDWTHIQRADGQTGWVLNRFVGPEIPHRVLLDKCRQDYEALSQKCSGADTVNQTLLDENKRLKERLSENVAATAERLEQLTRENEKLTKASQKRNRLFRAFLYGAGVLLVGIFIGSRGKKERRRYSL